MTIMAFKNHIVSLIDTPPQTTHREIIMPTPQESVLETLNKVNLLTGESGLRNRHIVANHPNLAALDDAISYLDIGNHLSVLTGEEGQANFNMIAAHQNPFEMAKALRFLPNVFANETNRDAIVAHQEPEMMAGILDILNKANLLAGNKGGLNRNKVITHPDPLSLCMALGKLSCTDLLTGHMAQAYFNMVVAHKNPMKIATSLCSLHSANLLIGVTNEVNLRVVLDHQNSDSMAEALCILHRTSLLTGTTNQSKVGVIAPHQSFRGRETRALERGVAGLTSPTNQANLNTVIAHRSPHEAAQVFCRLYSVGLLTEFSSKFLRGRISIYQNPIGMIWGLDGIDRTSLSSIEGKMGLFNRWKAVTHRAPATLYWVLTVLESVGLLAEGIKQANFDALINNANILFSPTTRLLWCRITADNLTADRFSRIMEIAEKNRATPEIGRAAFSSYINQIAPLPFKDRLSVIEYNGEIDPRFICPISKEIMNDPVTISNGQTYDRTSLKAFAESCRNQETREIPEILLCPLTRQPFKTAEIENGTTFIIKQFIDEFVSAKEKESVKKADHLVKKTTNIARSCSSESFFNPSPQGSNKTSESSITFEL